MYDKNNIFAKIIRGELAGDKIYEDDKVLAIQDKFPVAKIHVLLIPKGEYISFADFTDKAELAEIGHFYKVVNLVCKKLELQEQGFRIVSNIGEFGGQTVPHMHLHILGGEKLKSMHK